MVERVTLDQLRTRRAAKWRRHPPDVIPVWVADMDFPVAPSVREVLAHHARQGDLGYASRDDEQRYVQALVDWQHRHHRWTVPVEHVHVLVDVLQGVAAAVATHTRPGDGIVLQTPAYPPLFAVIEQAGRRVVANPLGPGGTLDVEHLRSVAGDATALVWCNPHNPTGRVFSDHELAVVAELAATSDLVLISDEIHADLTHPPHRHRPLGTVDGAGDRTITLTSASKTFAMPGLSCAAAIGPPPLLDPIRTMPKGLLGHPSVLGLRAAEAAWTDGLAWLDEVKALIRANLDHAQRRLAGTSLRADTPEGTYLLWVDARRLGWDVEPAERLLHDGRVAVAAGPEFGPGGAGHFRLNVATVGPVLDEALDRIITTVAPTR